MSRGRSRSAHKKEPKNDIDIYVEKVSKWGPRMSSQNALFWMLPPKGSPRVSQEVPKVPQRPFYIHFGAQIVQELLPHQVRAPKKGPKMATQHTHTHKKHTPNNLEMESASAFTKCLFVGCGLLKGLPGGPKPPRSPILFFGCLFREDPQGSPRSSPVAMDPTGLLVWLLCRLCNDADVRTDADVGTVQPRFDVFRR